MFAGGRLKKRFANRWKFRKKWLLLRLSEGIWNHLYARTIRSGRNHSASGHSSESWPAGASLLSLACPRRRRASGSGQERVLHHPRAVSHGAGAQALRMHAFFAIRWRAVGGGESLSGHDLSAHRDFGRGEINAHSRVQMALGEAKIRARAEFEQALLPPAKLLRRFSAYAAQHRQLRSPFYPVPQRRGIAGGAANFVLHVSNLIDGKARLAMQAEEI